ncbi:MAG: hypothetical protein K0R03_2294 [Moraxellaceae bacterium]|jgi:predicted enzyme related to lactoylglutathione lyase|nr:hypothetical protein [Moraxellaceae bacterium]
MSIDNAIASVAVRDLRAATAWYEALLERAPDARPMPEVAEWQFAHGGWLQVYQLPERAGNGSVTLAVSNLDEVVARGAALGLDMRQRSAGPKARTLMVTDPDGNHIAFAEALDPNMAH